MMWVPHCCSAQGQAAWSFGQPGLWEVSLPVAGNGDLHALRFLPRSTLGFYEMKC